MFGVKIFSDWDISENDTTSEEIYLNRRKFIENVGKLGSNIVAFGALSNFLNPIQVFAENSISRKITTQNTKNLIDFQENITSENLTSRYNNFYEFGTNKANISFLAKKLQVGQWSIKVEGLVHKPKVLDVDKIIQAMPLEQRVYRLRCVETWSAIIPWSGFPLRELIKLSNPLSTARYVKFKTFIDPNIAPGQKNRFWEPWPLLLRIPRTQSLRPGRAGVPKGVGGVAFASATAASSLDSACANACCASPARKVRGCSAPPPSVCGARELQR